MSRRPGSLTGKPRRKKINRIVHRDGGRCLYCRKGFSNPAAEATLDHFLPYAAYRVNALWNLVLACKGCNERKADALPLTLAWLLLATYRPALQAAA